MLEILHLLDRSNFERQQLPSNDDHDENDDSDGIVHFECSAKTSVRTLESFASNISYNSNHNYTPNHIDKMDISNPF